MTRPIPGFRGPGWSPQSGATAFDGLEVVPLVDAEGAFPASWDSVFEGATQADWDRARELDPAAFGGDGNWHLPFRCYALRSPSGHVTLVDTGVGPVSSPASAWAPTPGSLPDLLGPAGINPTGINAVVLTHLHEDHTGWVVDETGTLMFPNATYHVQRREVDWLRGADPVLYDYAVRPLEESGQLMFANGRTRLPIGDRSARTKVTLLPTPGHTPGHQSVLVEARDDTVILAGDVIVHTVQVVSPHVTYRFESDSAVAVRSRLTLMALARDRHASLGAAHTHHPFLVLDDEDCDPLEGA